MERGRDERDSTVREALHRHLRVGWMTASQLSSAIGIAEKAVPGHLEHLRRSAAAAGERFEVDPPVCNGCDYVFRERDRLTRPSRCPKCKSERIEAPRFRLVGRGAGA